MFISEGDTCNKGNKGCHGWWKYGNLYLLLFSIGYLSLIHGIGKYYFPIIRLSLISPKIQITSFLGTRWNSTLNNLEPSCCQLSSRTKLLTSFGKLVKLCLRIGRTFCISFYYLHGGFRNKGSWTLDTQTDGWQSDLVGNGYVCSFRGNPKNGWKR